MILNRNFLLFSSHRHLLSPSLCTIVAFLTSSSVIWTRRLQHSNSCHLDGGATAGSAEKQDDTSEAFACTIILGTAVVFFHARFAQMEAHRREWIIKSDLEAMAKTIDKLKALSRRVSR